MTEPDSNDQFSQLLNVTNRLELKIDNLTEPDWKNQISQLLDVTNRLELKIDNLTQKVDQLSKSCNNMDSHIQFVEATYDTLKHPINSALRALKF